MLLANLTPTVKAIATGGTFFPSGDASTRYSSAFTIWYRVFDETARKIPDEKTLLNGLYFGFKVDIEINNQIILFSTYPIERHFE